MQENNRNDLISCRYLGHTHWKRSERLRAGAGHSAADASSLQLVVRNAAQCLEKCRKITTICNSQPSSGLWEVPPMFVNCVVQHTTIMCNRCAAAILYLCNCNSRFTDTAFHADIELRCDKFGIHENLKTSISEVSFAQRVTKCKAVLQK